MQLKEDIYIKTDPTDITFASKSFAAYIYVDVYTRGLTFLEAGLPPGISLHISDH